MPPKTFLTLPSRCSLPMSRRMVAGEASTTSPSSLTVAKGRPLRKSRTRRWRSASFIGEHSIIFDQFVQHSDYFCALHAPLTIFNHLCTSLITLDLKATRFSPSDAPGGRSDGSTDCAQWRFEVLRRHPCAARRVVRCAPCLLYTSP